MRYNMGYNWAYNGATRIQHNIMLTFIRTSELASWG
jgi:hypothetical protein